MLYSLKELKFDFNLEHSPIQKMNFFFKAFSYVGFELLSSCVAFKVLWSALVTSVFYDTQKVEILIDSNRFPAPHYMRRFLYDESLLVGR